MQSASFRINAPDVINEVIEGEAIILHLGTGRYYSARGCGAEAWGWLSMGVSTGRVAELLSGSYDASPDQIDRALEEFTNYLVAEGLVVAGPAAPATVPAPADGQAKRAFDPPTMESFSDLEDLLLLDPVHEVSTELGWPHVAEPADRS